MFNFTFYNPVRIHFGEGQISQLSQELAPESRVLVTYGGGSVLHNGVMEQVRTALTGRTTIEFGGIEPNPTYETLMRAVALARAENIDFLLAVGGGSVLDGTKFIAAATPFAGEPWDMLAKGSAIHAALPLGAVLTLPATGSECNTFAVISRAATQDKLAFGNPLLFPRFAILDPATTYTLPARQIGNGAVDAFVHVMEQYLTYPVDAKIQDRFAESILLTLIEEGPRALAEPRNYAVRSNLMWAATMALNGLIGVGVPQDWATHMIGHEITARHGLDHAQTLAIVLPAMLQIQRAAKRDKLLQYAERVWGLVDGDAEQRIDGAIMQTRAFFERMQLKTRLSEYGIGAETIAPLLNKLAAHGGTALGERKEVSLAVSRQVLEMAV